jgi:ankyrin repeat domain-containing protein 50
MSSQIEAELKQLLESSLPDFEDLNLLMEKVSSVSQEQFIVIDAIDECEKAERSLFLSALQRLMNLPRVKLKIFLTSGLHIEIELERVLRPNHRMSMASPDAHSDIKTYIENTIAEKGRNGELVVGQPQLIIEIQDALVRGAQGM